MLACPGLKGAGMKRISVLASSVVVALAASGLIAPAASAQQNLIDTLSGASSTDSTLACVAARISATSSESVTQVVLDLVESAATDTTQTGVWLVEDNAGAVGSNALGYFGYSTGSIYAQGSPVVITAGTVFWIVFKQYNPSAPSPPYTRAQWTSDVNSNSGPWTYETFTGDYVADGTCVTSGSTFTSFTQSNAFNNQALKVRLVGAGGSSGSGDDATSQVPAPVMQQVGMPSAGCAAYDNSELNIGGAGSGGWGQTWAQWVNNGEGVAVCTRTLVYSPTFASWIVG